MNPYKLLYSYFVENSPSSSVDLNIFEAGFQNFGSVIDLCHDFKAQKFIGVEKSSFEDVQFLNLQGHGNCFSSSESIFERYQEYFTQNREGSPMNLQQFEGLFTVHLETSIEEFIVQNISLSCKPHIGIFNKLFHKFEDKKTPLKILDWFKTVSTSNAIVLMAVMTKSPNHGANDYLYSESQIEELIAKFDGEVCLRECISDKVIGFKTEYMLVRKKE